MREIYFTLDEKELKTLSRITGKDTDGMTSAELASALHQLLDMAYEEPEQSFEVQCKRNISIKGVSYWSIGKKYLVFTRDFKDYTAESDVGESYLSLDILSDDFVLTDIEPDILRQALSKTKTEDTDFFGQQTALVN